MPDTRFDCPSRDVDERSVVEPVGPIAVLKVGGTSMADPVAMAHVVAAVATVPRPGITMVVVSALAGVTEALIGLLDDDTNSAVVFEELHDRNIGPARAAGIAIRVRNSRRPWVPGTRIDGTREDGARISAHIHTAECVPLNALPDSRIPGPRLLEEA